MDNDGQHMRVGDLVTFLGPTGQLNLFLRAQRKLGIITRIYILTHTEKAIVTTYWIGGDCYSGSLMEELELVSAGRRFSDIS